MRRTNRESDYLKRKIFFVKDEPFVNFIYMSPCKIFHYFVDYIFINEKCDENKINN